MNAIPLDTAAGLCEEIRNRNLPRWYSAYGWWCRGCYKYSKGAPEKSCFYSPPENRGCSQVNKLFDKTEQGRNK